MKNTSQTQIENQLTRLQHEAYLNKFFNEIYTYQEAFETFQAYIGICISLETFREFFENEQLGTLFEIVNEKGFELSYTQHISRQREADKNIIIKY